MTEQARTIIKRLRAEGKLNPPPSIVYTSRREVSPPLCDGNDADVDMDIQFEDERPIARSSVGDEDVIMEDAFIGTGRSRDPGQVYTGLDHGLIPYHFLYPHATINDTPASNSRAEPECRRPRKPAVANHLDNKARKKLQKKSFNWVMTLDFEGARAILEQSPIPFIER